MIGQGDFRFLGRDQHQLVAEQINARVLLDQLVPRAVIHPVEVGRYEHVGGRAVLDLFDQRRTRGIARHHPHTAFPSEGLVNVVQGVFQRCSGEHGDGRILRARI